MKEVHDKEALLRAPPHLSTRSCSLDVQELKAIDGVSCNVTYAESFVENKNVFQLDKI